MLNVRCGRNGCRKRYVRRKHPDAYVRRHWARCSACGGNLNVDSEVHRRHKRETCKCSGIPWPHRIYTILDRHQFCHKHEFVDVDSYLMAKEMGGEYRRMKPGEECPF